MKSYIYDITSVELPSFFNDEKFEKIIDEKNVLIQIFSGEEIAILDQKVKFIYNKFPNAKIATSTTDGEINQSKASVKSTIISISIFKNTSINIYYSDIKDDFELGQDIAKNLIKDKTKLLIIFADGLFCNGEELLNGVSSISKDIKVAGGLAGDNAEFKNCYIGKDDKLYNNGAVGISLDSDVLLVNSVFNFGWEAVGIKHTVTKSIGNRVYTIDNMRVVDFYKKYLGEAMVEKLPATGIEFPIILDTNGLKKARAVTNIYDDGSLSFAGNVPEGSDVYIGVGDYENIVSDNIFGLNYEGVESFFIYSCMARRRFVSNFISKELELFSNIADSVGFFTYGEFYKGENKLELLNQTLTAVALSESKNNVSMKHKSNKNKNLKSKDRTFQALTNIISVTSKELHEQTLKQEQIAKELEAKTNTLNLIQEMANIGSWEFILSSRELILSKDGYKHLNIDFNNTTYTYEMFLNSILPDYKDKFEEFEKRLHDGNIQTVTCKLKNNLGKVITLVYSGKMIFENSKPIKIIGTTLDITEIKAKDDLLIQQAKLAQMGEMVNMIAHQWRQPLNAISTTAIQIEMQSEMEILTKEDVKKTTSFIEYMTQNMSQTIDDFINFTKPTNYKEIMNFRKSVDEILKIMRVQLENHNIEIVLDIKEDIYLNTYKKELEHVIINILNNAKEALDEENIENKQIIISIKKEKDICVIKIKDNGGGIDSEIIDRIFEPYFTTKASNKGTGLGLYMSKKIVEEHLGGFLRVKNVDNGVEFSIKLKDCIDD